MSARPPLWNSGSPVVAHNQEPPSSDKKCLEIDPDADCISCKIGNDIEATWEKSHIWQLEAKSLEIATAGDLTFKVLVSFAKMPIGRMLKIVLGKKHINQFDPVQRW